MPPPMKSKTKCFRTDGLKVIILPLFQKSHLQKHSFFFRILVLVQLILPRQMVTPREGPSHALATAGASFYPLDLPDICHALERQAQRPSSPCLLFGGSDTPGTWLPSPLSFPGEANGFLGGKSEGAFHTWTLFPVSVCTVSHWNPGTAQDVEQAETHVE